MDLDGGFFDAPFPNLTRTRSDGSFDASDFPADGATVFVDRYLGAIDRYNEGFGRNTAVWFPISAPINPASLPPSPRLEPSIRDSVFLIGADPSAPDFGSAIPIELSFKADAETYSPANLLVMVPVQGHVLRAGSRYAAVVTRDVRDAGGAPLAVSSATRRIVDGEGELGEAAAPLVARFETAGRDPGDIAAITVFDTGRVLDRTTAIAAAVEAMPAPPISNVALLRTHAGYTVYQATVELPMLQVGPEPYSDDGTGHIELDGDGQPVVQTTETARISLSIPDGPVPPEGFPLLIYAAGQGGSYTQVVDRGFDNADDDGDGDGPAMFLTNRGIAALGIEANLTGPRHPSGERSGVPFFNFENLAALLDNHRQAVAEIGLLARLAGELSFPRAGPPGNDTISFDPERILLHGHSTGSVISAIAIAVQPRIRAAILSGAGGSWLYNLTIKQTPPVADLVALLLQLRGLDRADRFDPLINLVAALLEPIEPINYVAHWATDLVRRDRPASVLLVGGYIDSYYLPEMIESLAVAGAMDVAEPVIDPAVIDGVDRVGGGAASAPLSGNAAGGEATVVLSQYPAVEGSDGHYVAFQVDEAKYQYSCFVASAVAGSAVSPAVLPPRSASGLDPCP